MMVKATAFAIQQGEPYSRAPLGSS
jgi:hypothetical protein